MKPKDHQTLLNFLKAYFAKHKRMPTIREIAAGLHLSHTATNYRLDMLEQAGLIEREKNISRGIKIVECDILQIDSTKKGERIAVCFSCRKTAVGDAKAVAAWITNHKDMES